MAFFSFCFQFWSFIISFVSQPRFFFPKKVYFLVACSIFGFLEFLKKCRCLLSVFLYPLFSSFYCAATRVSDNSVYSLSFLKKYGDVGKTSKSFFETVVSVHVESGCWKLIINTCSFG